MDIITTSFFLDNISGSSPYGISFSPSTNPNQLQIKDSNNNQLFPEGYQSILELQVPKGYQTAIAETDGIWTVTEPTLVAYTTYGFTLTQYYPFGVGGGNIGNTNPPIRVEFNTGAGVLTAGTAATAWALAINNLQSKGIINCTATSAGAVLTVTAGAGFPLLNLNQPQGIVVIANGTPGVQSLGYPTDLANAGYTLGTPPVGYLSTGVYDKISFFYNVPLPGALAGSRVQKKNAILWADENATNFSAWKTYLLSVLEGTIAGFAISATKRVN